MKLRSSIPGFAIVALLSASLLAGCASVSGPGRPKSWFGRLVTLDFRHSPVERAAQSSAGSEQASLDLERKAQEMLHGISAVAPSLPESPERQIVADFAATGSAALAAARGPLPIDRQQYVEQLVAGLRSTGDSAAKAGREWDTYRARVAAADAVKREWEADKARWQRESAQWAVERDATARKWERARFWVIVCLSGYALIAWVLPVAGAAFPALRGASMIAQGVVAPFAVGALRRTKGALTAVVNGVEVARKQVLAATPEVKARVDAALADHVYDHHDEVVQSIRREEGLI